ncbi:AbrB family transcriptional regulator [Rhodobacteraceae bacterium]|nr:AbrB family transcriptional regulator [Paracoccaceae bacterium]
MPRPTRKLGAMLIPLAICTAAGSALQLAGVANGMLVGAFVAALFLSRTYPAMEEVPGGVIVMQIIVGLSVGESLRNHLGMESGSLALLVVGTLIALVIQWLASFSFLRIFRWRRADAALAAYPGAMASVLELTDRNDVNPSVILVHVVRVFVIATGASLMMREQSQVVWTAPGTVEGLLIIALNVIACLTFGKLLAMAAMPAPFLLAAVLTTLAAGHLSPQYSFSPPPIALNVAEALLAVAVMIRLKKVNLEQVRGHMVSIFLVICVMAAVSILTALCLTKFRGGGFEENVLGIVPGGIESVAIIAVGAGLNVAAVMKMHLIRLIAVQVIPTLIIQGGRACQWFRGRAQPKENPD